MKQEDLKRLSEAADGFMRRVDVLAAEELLPTLLREREQLLGALRAIVNRWVSLEWGPPPKATHVSLRIGLSREEYEQARAAIAAAES